MLSIDGVHIENDLGLHLLQDSDETALPQVRDNTVTIPGRHGAYSFDSYLEPRQFFEYILIPTQATLNDVQKIVRKVSTLLLDQYGKPKEVKLVFDYEPDKFYKAKFSGFISINRIAKAGIFPIPFKAYDPYAYSNVFANDITWGSKVVTFQDNYLLGDKGTSTGEKITRSKVIEIYNYGYTVRPTFIIKGSANDLKVSTNGKAFTLKTFADKTYEIDGEKCTVKNGNLNAFSDMIGEFLEITPEDNMISIDGNNIDIELTIKYRFKHM
ncbi:distal tail protein Dit [Virgibacillus sp. Bac332]|uniref:distal tail protein Dit n=1 Tax=Virgibacillus sp. Bac332 TaxID=2419842 RepID=UPI000EF47F6C|nr:distal tail protein Dit [Virgibacillus sp. Bac332]